MTGWTYDDDVRLVWRASCNSTRLHEWQNRASRLTEISAEIPAIELEHLLADSVRPTRRWLLVGINQLARGVGQPLGLRPYDRAPMRHHRHVPSLPIGAAS